MIHSLGMHNDFMKITFYVRHKAVKGNYYSFQFKKSENLRLYFANFCDRASN